MKFTGVVDAYLCPEVVAGGLILIIQVTKRVELSLKKIKFHFHHHKSFDILFFH